MLFDTHAHPYMNSRKSPEAILENFFETPANYMISIGCNIKTSQTSIELAKRYPKLKASIGFHPVDIPLFDNLDDNMQILESLYLNNTSTVVALWETWLDYYWLDDITKKSWIWKTQIQATQASYFRAQIALAKKLALPFIIHSRESNPEVLEILQREKAQNYVFHCFSGDWKFAQKVLAQNPQALFGFGWILTYKKSLDLHEVAQNLPLANILLETDAPFLTPEPLRGKEENESSYLSYVLKKLQELRSESPEEIEHIVYENAKKFYRV